MILIPAAGHGARFKAAGYTVPKHLIPLGGKPMVEWVTENVLKLDDGPVIVADQNLVGQTRGAVETVLAAASRVYIDPDRPLVVANCDQLIRIPDAFWPRSHFFDGIIFTFQSANTAHSYVTTTGFWEIDSIAEKPENPPSDKAVSGVYWFRYPTDFIESCRVVNAEVEGEQYISAAIADMLSRGCRLAAVECSTAILGTPEDFQRFEVALSCAA